MIITPGEDARFRSTPPSLIPEHIEAEVMSFIISRVRMNYKENEYVIDDISALASALIIKYDLEKLWQKK